MVYDVAPTLFGHLQRLSLRFHHRQSVGDSIRRVTTDCGCVSVIVKDAVLPFVAALVSFAAMFYVMWRMEPRLTLVSIAVAPWLVLVLRRYMHADARAQLRATGRGRPDLRSDRAQR